MVLHMFNTVSEIKTRVSLICLPKEQNGTITVMPTAIAASHPHRPHGGALQFQDASGGCSACS
jgi:hypothetical protein